MEPVPDLAEVDRIAVLDDPVRRNLQITQCYYELSAAMARRTGTANWCTFAAWASKQAGQTIRKDDLFQALEHALATTPSSVQAAGEVAAAARQLGAQPAAGASLDWVWQALDPAAAIEAASAAVARGNQKVFEEIGREFARFAAACLGDAAFAAEHIESFCGTLRDGDPPNGQTYLRQAFGHYYQALFEAEPKARAELMLLGSIEIGFHEQTRLQPNIVAALEASLSGPHQVARRLIETLFPERAWAVYALVVLKRLLGRPTLLELVAERLSSEARRVVRRVLTDHLMVLGFPHDVRLRLREDLRAEFPAVLQHLSNADLRGLLLQLDPTPDNVLESGATDWGDLPERLHYIVDLFRCYGTAPDLLEPPFTASQAAAIKAGQVPAGRL